MTKYRFLPIELLKSSTESSRIQRLEYVQRIKNTLDSMFAFFKTGAKTVDYGKLFTLIES